MDGLRGYRTHGAASLKLGYSMAIPSHMRGGIREITNLYTLDGKRRAGDAGRLLNEVCMEADDAGVVLMLMPKPFDTDALDELGLIAFYARHGFTLIQQSPTLMARALNG